MWREVREKMELEIKDVIHTYPNKKTALNRISLTLTPGIYGLLGPNGAGKSTLMKIITGNMQPSGGKVLFNGSDIKELGRAYRDRLGYMPQQQGLYNQFTGRRFLWYMATLKGLSHREAKYKINDLLEQMNLTEVSDRKIGGYSGGMKQRLLIAQAVMNSPDILVLDEPTAGLDPRERIRFRNLLVELSKDRVVIFSTHIIEDISSSCNQVVVINKGELKYFGDPSDMVEMANGKVWQFNIDKTEFEKALDKSLVIHHIQQGDTIRVRYLSVEQPYEGAEEVEANLEDAYLCLLKNMN